MVKQRAIKTKYSFKKFAFTLAEVLIVISIVGIVAELTIPTLYSNFQKQETITNLKKQYTSLAQAVKLSETDNGNVSTWDWGIANDTASIRASFDTYWAPYLKILKYCNSYVDCGYKSNYYKNLSKIPNGFNIYYPVSRTTVVLADGAILIVSGYISDTQVLKSAIIDINGAKKPNTFGKDVFWFDLDKDMGLVPKGYNDTEDIIKTNCGNHGYDNTCATKIIRDGWQIKEDYPW